MYVRALIKIFAIHVQEGKRNAYKLCKIYWKALMRICLSSFFKISHFYPLILDSVFQPCYQTLAETDVWKTEAFLCGAYSKGAGRHFRRCNTLQRHICISCKFNYITYIKGCRSNAF